MIRTSSIGTVLACLLLFSLVSSWLQIQRFTNLSDYYNFVIDIKDGNAAIHWKEDHDVHGAIIDIDVDKIEVDVNIDVDTLDDVDDAPISHDKKDHNTYLSSSNNDVLGIGNAGQREEMKEYIRNSIETRLEEWKQFQQNAKKDHVPSIFTRDEYRTSSNSARSTNRQSAVGTIQDIQHTLSMELKNINCTKWIIIAPQSKRTPKLISIKDWCTIIVRHETYEVGNGKYHTVQQVTRYIKEGKEHDNDPIQNYMKALAGKNTAHSRRNFGYLLAIIHGAEYILDLDEHSIFDRAMGDETKDLTDDDVILPNSILEASVVIQGRVPFNPYPLLFNPTDRYPSSNTNSSTSSSTSTNTNTTVIESNNHMSYSWPRGFPGLIESSQREFTKGKIAFQKNFSLSSASSSLSSNIYHVGVVQLVGHDHQDIGLVQQFQQQIERQDSGLEADELDPEQWKAQLPIVVPSHSYAPYNMHSTIHMPSAFWSLILPISLSPIHADIARSYFAQCLFVDVGIRVVYSPSMMMRTGEEILEDHSKNATRTEVDAEIDMLVRLDSLILFLSEWDSPCSTLPARIEHLWRDLYVHNFIYKEDVLVMQLWLQSLREIGYKFPALAKRRYRNVAIMGHFNYAQSPTQVDDVVFWTQKYREWFETVIVTGPFSKEVMTELGQHSIRAFDGAYHDTGGYFQVTENLKNTLLYFKNWTKIESVMYFHDDGMINVTELSQGKYPFPTNDIIGNYRDQRYDLSYANIRTIEDVELANQFSYRIYPNATVCAFNKTLCQPSVKHLYRALPLYQWGMTRKAVCGENQQTLAQDEEVFPYHEDDGSLLFSSFTQSDFLHMPLKYADEFANLASLFLKHKIIHECTWGTIIDMIRQNFNATVRLTYLCTSWGPKRRGKKPLIERCMRDRVDYGVFHPYKIGYKENGYQGYDWALDIVQDRQPL